MTREDFVAVAARLFAVWIGIKAVGSIPLAIAAREHDLGDGTWQFGIFLALLMLAIAIVLWLFPLTIGRKLLPVMKTPGTPVAWQSAGALELALTVLGFWLLASSLGDAFYWLTMAFLSIRAKMPLTEWADGDRASAVTTIVEIAIAFVLILGHRGLLAAFARIRGAGGRDIAPE